MMRAAGSSSSASGLRVFASGEDAEESGTRNLTFMVAEVWVLVEMVMGCDEGENGERSLLAPRPLPSALGWFAM